MKVADAPRRVVLIGAARSGTKILRDSLAAASGAGAVPYDIGYVWRCASPDHPDDALDPATLTPGRRRFIANFIDGYAGSSGWVIEKTVGNALRVLYVAAVLPDAIYVHLVRDGIDVAESTRRQWQESTDYRYLLKKSRHFPLRMVPSYGRGYVSSRLRRHTGAGRVATWGARYPGIDDDLRHEDLLTVCARQWQEAVVRASRDLAALGALGATVVDVRYEDLVRYPEQELERVTRLCGLPATEQSIRRAASAIQAGRAGEGGRALNSADRHLLDTEIGWLLANLGYPTPMPEQRRDS